ncbi:alpha/beta fold hydrolase [Maribacter cobaltidurans]|uniref:Alpha/beta hydrolase n=1 Tax=Maribacter cobaltidurans TaxID=1178778 RepID=A0A223V2U8_9FLAO|nr:alpha/beta hydrolase [Maribacter cobaltidurans]ASV29328.1 alpha/beta hydrolase [Maribacter cobaltidurans]GGD69964.1 alpha/beta hydrolase [Maribacter cobaltidurans]
MKKMLNRLIPKFYGFLLNIYVLLSPQKAAEKAFKIFSKVRKGRVLPHQKTYLDPVRLERLEVSGHTIQTYKWPGVKDTVLLIHGWESNTWRWHKLLEKLTKADFNVIAFDAPAHGYSSGEHLYVPLYAEVLEKIITTFKPNHLIGHSVGGMTILYNEYKNPNKNIEKIVTIGSPSEFHEIIKHFQNLLGLSNRMINALEKYVIKRFGFTIKEFSSSSFVKENDKKGLLLHDRFDKITPYHASEKVHAVWAESKLISTEGLGHSMHQDEVNNEIIAFLQE